MHKIKRSSLRSIADALGLTSTTVSCILGNRGGSYAAETKAQVIEEAKRQKYRPNRIYAGISGGLTGMAGVLIENKGHFLSNISGLLCIFGMLCSSFVSFWSTVLSGGAQPVHPCPETVWAPVSLMSN